MDLPKVVELAIPAFVVLILIEAALGYFDRRRADYEVRDTAASLLMGLGNFSSGLLTGVLYIVAAEWLYQYRLFDIGYAWWAFVLVFFLEDLCYYWFHRFSHEHRFWWAAHVNHHSSQHYNLSTALRQTWTGNLCFSWVVWLPLSLLGFPTALIVFQKGVSLVYQFWIHTEAVRRLPAPIEWLFNTPSHHRVHHATNPRYLDRNYAGILIIWDRIFGTFVQEDDALPCRYGIVKQIGSFNPLRIAFHEWWEIARDLKGSRSLREAIGYLFGPPGWSPDGSRLTSEAIRARAIADRASAPS
ncbi:sterol desaturase family protein [Oceanibacterium hippocampi]|uniref:Fatty acid hydroxylase superfamily protein n=1 Tax=Oceanibacterium hippocampi TaxID=745714 RepID=A0A1Y5TUD6_9PROT|nr:sterol desaturase family protein [Oceanibacterium hippocampi]SLN72824.1 Fatty acid hydroxylase superfamily protein [Oceanibacterium hippocampi]